jgi:hypothetical protein
MIETLLEFAPDLPCLSTNNRGKSFTAKHFLRGAAVPCSGRTKIIHSDLLHILTVGSIYRW